MTIRDRLAQAGFQQGTATAPGKQPCTVCGKSVRCKRAWTLDGEQVYCRACALMTQFLLTPPKVW